MWDVHRFYLSLAKKKKYQREWLKELRAEKKIALPDGSELPIDPKTVDLFFEYSDDRDKLFEEALALLRTEEEALDYCAKNQINVLKTRNSEPGPPSVIEINDCCGDSHGQ